MANQKFFFILFIVVSIIKASDINPIELVSFTLTKDNIPDNEKAPTLFYTNLPLNSKKEQLDSSKVIGSIS